MNDQQNLPERLSKTVFASISDFKPKTIKIKTSYGADAILKSDSVSHVIQREKGVCLVHSHHGWPGTEVRGDLEEIAAALGWEVKD